MMKVRLLKNNNWLIEAGYTEEEEKELYNRQLQEVIDDPGWYLDNLEYMALYRVRWKDYRRNTPTLPKGL